MTLLFAFWLALKAPVGLDAPSAAEAKALYPVLDEAYSLYKSGRFDAAIAAFERAYAIRPEPRFVLNIAVSHRDAGRCRRAMADFERFFQVCHSCPQLEAARGVLVDTQRRCTPRVELTAKPVDAYITVDGEARGQAPMALDLMVGPHVVRASAQGYVTAQKPFIVKPGAPVALELQLAPEAAPVPISTPPPLTSPESDGGFGPWTTGAFALAGVGALAGGAFGLLLLDDLQRESEAQTRKAQDEARDDARRDARFAQIGVGVALMGAALGVTLWALEDDALAMRISADSVTASLSF